MTGFKVGSGDRAPLNYLDMAGFKSLDGNDVFGTLGANVSILKIQAPRDNSSDARGGIGRMTPMTLLIKNKEASFVRLVPEEASGHSTLLKLALKQKGQVAYVYGQNRGGFMGINSELHIFTETLPAEPAEIGW
jgi:hypothetical protein